MNAHLDMGIWHEYNVGQNQCLRLVFQGERTPVHVTNEKQFNTLKRKSVTKTLKEAPSVITMPA